MGELRNQGKNEVDAFLEKMANGSNLGAQRASRSSPSTLPPAARRPGTRHVVYRPICFGRRQRSVGSTSNWFIIVAFPNAVPRVGCHRLSVSEALWSGSIAGLGKLRLARSSRMPSARTRTFPCRPWCSSVTRWRRGLESCAMRRLGSRYRYSCSKKATTNEVKRVFERIARLTKGAHGCFDTGAASQLRALLRSVAAYAAGGILALENLSHRDGGAARLLAQLK